MSTQTSAYARLSRWNPFRPLANEAEARDAARMGAYAALFRLVVEAAGAVGFLSFNAAAATPAGAAMLALELTLVLLWGLMAWRVWFRQGRWSSMGVAIVFGLSTLGDLAGMIAGRSNASLFLLIVLSGAVIAGVRGSWRLHQLKSRKPIDSSVFD